MARPTKYNDAIARPILDVVVTGGGRAFAARFCGIGSRTLTRWLTRGRAGDPVYAGFAEQFEAAEGTARRRHRLWMARVEAAGSRRRWEAYEQRRRATRHAAATDGGVVAEI